MESFLSLRTISFYSNPMDLDSPNALSDAHSFAQKTDTEVWNALKAGESQALSILYERYSSLVYRLALRILGNSQDAEDLTQDIFLTLWRLQSCSFFQ
jgi:RNA polymerase sigma-70 factor (ECF subfamily)